MTDHKNKKQGKEKGVVNPVAAAVAGVVVGAGIAVAGTIALNDEKNMNKIKKAVSGARDQAKEYIGEVRKSAQDKKEKVKGKIAMSQKEAVKTIKTA